MTVITRIRPCPNCKKKMVMLIPKTKDVREWECFGCGKTMKTKAMTDREFARETWELANNKRART